MTGADLLLARMLGEVHALWLPLRNPMAVCWGSIWEIRRHYPRRGLPWRGGGSKEQARALTTLVQHGMVRKVRGKEKTTSAVLTKGGVLQGGLLVGFGRNEAECFTAELLKHGPAGCWVPEIALNDGHGWGDGQQDELVCVEFSGIQALVLHYAESNCDIRGRVYYRVTPAGLTAVQEWDGRSPDPPEVDPAIMESYQDGLEAGLARLTALPQLPREIGEIPLPVSWGGCQPSDA